MGLSKKNILKIVLITMPLSILFFLFVYIIEINVSGGLADAWGFPFLVYYNLYSSPGVEFYNPLVILVDIFLIYLVFTIIGLLYLFLKDKKIKMKL
jgi:hypothetical protein